MRWPQHRDDPISRPANGNPAAAANMLAHKRHRGARSRSGAPREKIRVGIPPGTAHARVDEATSTKSISRRAMKMHADAHGLQVTKPSHHEGGRSHEALEEPRATDEFHRGIALRQDLEQRSSGERSEPLRSASALSLLEGRPAQGGGGDLHVCTDEESGLKPMRRMGLQRTR